MSRASRALKCCHEMIFLHGAAVASRLLPVLALCTVAACVFVPLPASRERTKYDNLAQEKPTAVSAAELKEKYGSPHLSCQNDRLWVYGWSVGHGGAIGAIWLPGGGGGDVGDLYVSFHVVVLSLDPAGELLQLETTGSAPLIPKTMCTSGGYCVRSQWKLTQGTEPPRFFCRHSYSGHCDSWILSPDSVLLFKDAPVDCR